MFSLSCYTFFCNAPEGDITMKEYTAVRCAGWPDWMCIPAVQVNIPLEQTDAKVSAQAQLCYDDTNLYVRLCAQEERIRAELTGPMDEVCEDSCLEFFFSPVTDDPRYINIECNPNGCLYVGIGPNAQDLIRLTPREHSVSPHVQRIPGGWETVYTVPYSFIRQHFPGFDPVSCGSMQANFYKCGDKTEIPHYLCWNPVPMQPCAFHNPAYFGTITFE
jgi:hypothetical protein